MQALSWCVTNMQQLASVINVSRACFCLFVKALTYEVMPPNCGQKLCYNANRLSTLLLTAWCNLLPISVSYGSSSYILARQLKSCTRVLCFLSIIKTHLCTLPASTVPCSSICTCCNECCICKGSKCKQLCYHLLAHLCSNFTEVVFRSAICLVPCL